MTTKQSNTLYPCLKYSFKPLPSILTHISKPKIQINTRFIISRTFVRLLGYGNIKTMLDIKGTGSCLGITQYNMCSVLWGMFSTVGDILSTVGDIIFCYLTTYTVRNTPTVLMISPHIYHHIPHGTEHPPRYSKYAPTVLNTHVIQGGY